MSAEDPTSDDTRELATDEARHWIALVRHGAPTVAPSHPAHSWSLTESARHEVAALASRLGALNLTIVVSSPEAKARQTAELIVPRGEIRLDDDLREHGLGSVPFLPTPDFERAVRAFFEHPEKMVLGSESATDAARRMDRALARLHGAPAIVVSHGRIISAYVSALLGVDGLPIWVALQMPDVLLVNRLKRQVRRLDGAARCYRAPRVG